MRKQKKTSLVPKHFGRLLARPFSQGMRVLRFSNDPVFRLASMPIFAVSEYLMLSPQLPHQITVCLKLPILQ
jgi:hypothetical protein